MEKEELKTLKDLKGKIKGYLKVGGKNIVVGGKLDNLEPTYINEDVLKREAIKILKADTKDLCEFLGVEELTNEEIKVIDLVIKKIFNITEEDLK